MAEFEMIDSIRQLLGDPPKRVAISIGDDAAVTRAGNFAVTSVDSIVDGVHFDRGSWDPLEIGWKAAATAISDLAAMAAEPTDLLVAVGLPSDITEQHLRQLFQGVADAAASCAMTIVGGDTVSSPVLWLSVTVVGYVAQASDAIGRGGGRADDVLLVTGTLGDARAGLALLRDPTLKGKCNLPQDECARLIARQQRPVPKISAAQALRSAGARAMIDLSDGLAGDVCHLASSSNCGAAIELASIPLGDHRSGVAKIAQELGEDPAEFAAVGGEDYELLAAMPPECVKAAQAALRATGTALTPIGKLVSSGPPRFTRPNGTDAKLQSFEHLT